MSFTVYVRMKKLGKQTAKDLAPVPFVLKQQPKTLRELLTQLTELLVNEYNQRKEQGQLLSFLTKEEIKEQAGRGKIAFGVHGGGDASVEEAVEHTMQCLEDGIYRVFAGEEELTEPEGEIHWSEEPIFTFVRLTMLSGW